MTRSVTSAMLLFVAASSARSVACGSESEGVLEPPADAASADAAPDSTPSDDRLSRTDAAVVDRFELGTVCGEGGACPGAQTGCVNYRGVDPDLVEPRCVGGNTGATRVGWLPARRERSARFLARSRRT